MSEMQDAFARGAFNKWLEETPPWICEEGSFIVWRGFAYGEGFKAAWYRVAIKRWADCAEIFVDCNNDSMRDWMQRHKSYIKGKLIWYCRAVWQLLDDGLLDADDFNKTEDQFLWDDADVDLEPWEKEQLEWERAMEDKRDY